MAERLLIRPSEAARRLRVSRECVRQRMAAGQLEAFHIEARSRRYVDAREVDRLRSQQRVARLHERGRILVSLREAGKRVGVNCVTVRNWVEAGHVEGFVVAGRRGRYVEAEQVETWALMRGGHTSRGYSS